MTDTLNQPLASPWSRLWQIPLLLLGIGLFVFGLSTFKQSRKPLPFETHARDIQNLLNANHYVDALVQVANIQEFYPERDQQAQLARLSGDAFYLAQQQQPGLVAENYEKAIKYYIRSVNLGLPESPLTTEHWAMASLALSQYEDAIERLEQLVPPDPIQKIDLARALVKSYLAVKPPEDSKALGLITQLTKASALDDRVWAHTKRLELTLGKPESEQAVIDAKSAVAAIKENSPAGILRTWIGRAEFESGHLDEAREDLVEARRQFDIVGHSVDEARAAILLGKIAQARAMQAKEPQRSQLLIDAMKQYQDVLTSHAGSLYIPAARLGRAEILALQGTPNEQMHIDYIWLMKTLRTETDREWELISLDSVRSSLVAQHDAYQHSGRTQDALQFLELARNLKDPEQAETALREALTNEQRADQITAELSALPADTPASQRNALFESALHHADLAAEAYLRHSHLATMQDAVSAESQWKAAHLFDRAGRSERAIRVLTDFTLQRPRDSRVPEALHTIGLLYQSLGQFDQAIFAYQRNMKENPTTPASYLSTVQLARCYMAQGEAQFPKAEQALLSLVQDNRDLLPSAVEFRICLFTLGELYYRTGRWANAILRLEEAITRYPDDRSVPRATFWLADAYRKSAAEIATAIKKDPTIEHRDQLEQSRQDRERRAAALFGQVVSLLDPEAASTATPDGVSPEYSLYLRYSYLYRADCLYDLGDYATAIRFYEQAATRFAQSITAVEAYVQIINAHLAMKDVAQARAAAERARWLLQHIPDEAFGQAPLALSRQYFSDFFKLGQLSP